MTFLPEGYEKPASNSKYLKLEEGDNKFRILSDAVVGWVDWREKEGGGREPVRTKEKVEAINPNKQPKHFWVFVVFDYKDQAIKILEVTQNSIRDAIFDLHGDESWGDPKGYDLNVKRTGKEMDTKYSVMPVPHKEIEEEIKKVYAETQVNLEKLFTNDDPFAINQDIDVSKIPM